MKPTPLLRWINRTVHLKAKLILQQKWQEVRLPIGRTIDMTEPLKEEWRDSLL